jgi:hypothetical protein
MRTAITLAILRDKSHTVIHAPGVAIPTQEETLRRFLRDPNHAEIAEVQLWTSDQGCVRRAQMRPLNHSKHETKPVETETKPPAAETKPETKKKK